MTRDGKIKVLQRWLDELWNLGRLEVANEILTEGFLNHSPTSPDIRSRAQLIEHVRDVRNGFRDFRFTASEILIDEEYVAVRLSASGKHEGEYGGIHPSGKEIVLDGSTFFRFENERIAEVWWVMDMLPILQAAGIIPSLEVA